MVKNINGLGGINAPKTNTEQSGKQAASPSSSPSSNSPASSDEVKLSQQAITLQTLTDKVISLPEVNVERAEQIKAALDRGEYKIDDLILADKILSSEALFGK